jgi:hypothetical protein
MRTGPLAVAGGCGRLSRMIRSVPVLAARAVLVALALTPLPGAALPLGASVAPDAGKPATGSPRVLLGPVTRQQVEAAVPTWVQAGIEAEPDLAAARALAGVEPGAEVTVLLGTWCGDSRREVARLWRALDAIGADAAGGPGGGLPFTLTYIGIDEAKQQPAAAVAAAGLQYVPTLIVRRGGSEVGRIVEKAPHGVEVDLLALLGGKAKGVVSASPQVSAGRNAPESAPPPQR